jgi:hypothetical protein
MDRDKMQAIVQPHATISDKIRALAAAGAPRAEIARFLGKRYQHVRNVLEGDAQAGGGYVLGKADLSGVREGGRRFERDEDAAYIDRRSATAFWLRVTEDGAVLLPDEMAQTLNAAPGQRVFAEIKDGRVMLMSAEAAADEVDAMMAKYIKPGRLASESLIADRIAEAEREGL